MECIEIPEVGNDKLGSLTLKLGFSGVPLDYKDPTDSEYSALRHQNITKFHRWAAVDPKQYQPLLVLLKIPPCLPIVLDRKGN